MPALRAFPISSGTFRLSLQACKTAHGRDRNRRRAVCDNSLGLRTTASRCCACRQSFKKRDCRVRFHNRLGQGDGLAQRFTPPRLRPGNPFRFGRRPSQLLPGRSDPSACKARAGAPPALAACGGARVLALRGCLAQRIGRGGPEQGAVYWEFTGVTQRKGLPPVTAMVAPGT